MKSFAFSHTAAIFVCACRKKFVFLQEIWKTDNNQKAT
jgi:hypothetical protein